MTVTQTRNEIGDALKELWIVMDLPFDDFIENLEVIFKDISKHPKEETKLNIIKTIIKSIKNEGIDSYMSKIKTYDEQKGKDKSKKQDVDVYHHKKEIVLTQDEQECFRKVIKYLETLDMSSINIENLHITSNTTDENLTKEFKDFIKNNKIKIKPN